MITLYSGTPGTGKSLHMAKEIKEHIEWGKPVIANFPIEMKNIGKIKRKNRTKADGLFYYWDNSEMTVQRLVEFARKSHKVGKESQTLICIDEASVLFNAREWQGAGKERMEWIIFFQQHRKLGYDIIMAAQQDRMIDKQIRGFIEYEVKHRKINNFIKFGLGKIADMLKIKLFVAVTMWYGGTKTKLEAKYFFYSPADARLYDTMAVFSREAGPVAATSDTLRAGVERPEACPEGVVASAAPNQRARDQRKPWRSFKLEKPKNVTLSTRGRSAVNASR